MAKHSALWDFLDHGWRNWNCIYRLFLRRKLNCLFIEYLVILSLRFWCRLVWRKGSSKRCWRIRFVFFRFHSLSLSLSFFWIRWTGVREGNVQADTEWMNNSCSITFVGWRIFQMTMKVFTWWYTTNFVIRRSTRSTRRTNIIAMEWHRFHCSQVLLSFTFGQQQFFNEI